VEKFSAAFGRLMDSLKAKQAGILLSLQSDASNAIKMVAGTNIKNVPKVLPGK